MKTRRKSLLSKICVSKSRPRGVQEYVSGRNPPPSAIRHRARQPCLSESTHEFCGRAPLVEVLPDARGEQFVGLFVGVGIVAVDHQGLAIVARKDGQQIEHLRGVGLKELG